jgi:hypothetical protein
MIKSVHGTIYAATCPGIFCWATSGRLADARWRLSGLASRFIGQMASSRISSYIRLATDGRNQTLLKKHCLGLN